MSDWTDEQFERLERRLKTFRTNPEKLSPLVHKKCAELHAEIERDSRCIDKAIRLGVDLNTLPSENPKRAALVEWLANTPDVPRGTK